MRFKEHIAHKTGNVAPCPNVIGVIRESMMNILKESKIKKIDKKRRKDEFLSQLREDEDEHEEFIDEVSAIRQATRESIQSQYEWHRREEFGRSTGEVGQGVKLPTPYEISDVYLKSEYQRVRDWVNGLKTHWKELGATLMCDGWTNSLNQMHIINFLVYCSKGTIFWKSVDALSFRSRDAEFYYSLLDSVVEEIGENYIVQIVTDNETAMKAAGKKLTLKRKHLYWTSCIAHCLDLYLEDIGKKPSVAKVLDEAKKVTCFIYNHIWTVDLMKKYTQGKQILRPALTRFATHFIQLEEITRQKQGLREMFNSKLLLFRDKHETLGSPQAQRAWKQMNPDGENAGVLPVDTFDNEMDVDQSQQQNLSHSSSSSTPSQSGDGPNGGSLSPIDEDDGYSGDREFDGNMFPEPRRDISEPRAPSKGKGKKHTSIGSSSGRRSSSSNLGYSDSSTSTQGFYPPEQPSYFLPSHGYPQPYGYYPPFPNYGVPYQPQMHHPPQMYHRPPPLMYPPPQIYPPYQLYENQGENVTLFGYIFGQRSRESS
ncbi:hypothetical protein CXB51_010855 [Gossypium anomalum]|uniref:DUF659 domain-containing protein n=1 Tax=Gossypium anomalum TaxID=47600 RepID=A0A8J5YUW4_9ROSI|nr:hypothetical protein CXB51_010855 [Gossypium anomalum]